MTREEAIYRLKNTAWLGTDEDREQTEQAVDMAIEALSADTVSRDVHVGIVNELVKRIEELKADSVKVVRCKDCRYRFYDEPNDCYMCDRHEYGESFEDDDFCSWGERREP